ncbi:hypothetical protein ASG11_17800 [Sphingomonas sp. Leaf357]|uniref:hypothetical protein n=1 Tax=Sphingomonas sp. Leaf357 TaxID=1736350 RepID=UPI0006FDF1F0|nr:hypothetical protein [Sphingomonas sp. Leaf357]KQS01508.1 hypothetical protein ASG11_17800 [Sphingomonas sp. Leaf357]
MTQIFTTGAIAIQNALGSNTLPNFDGVRGEFWFGGTLADSRLNAITGNMAGVIGSPSIQPGYAALNYTDNTGFFLDIPLPASASVLMLMRSAGGPVILNPSSFEYNVIATLEGKISAGHGGASGSTDQAILDQPNAGNFTLFMANFTVGQLARIYRIDANGTVFDDATLGGYTVPTTRSTNPIQVMGRLNANYQGAADIAALAIVENARGQAYLEAVYPLYKAFAQSRGCTVN